MFYTRKSYSRIGAPPGGRELNLLPKEPIESFSDVLLLGVQPFLCFAIESRIVVQGHLVVVEN